MAAAVSYAPASWDARVLFSQGGVLSAQAKALLNSAPGQLTLIPMDPASAQAVSANWSAKPSNLKVGATIGSDVDRLRAFGGRVAGAVSGPLGYTETTKS
jgi:hypothetical protein